MWFGVKYGNTPYTLFYIRTQMGRVWVRENTTDEESKIVYGWIMPWEVSHEKLRH
jgi:hypothetical protein